MNKQLQAHKPLKLAQRLDHFAKPVSKLDQKQMFNRLAGFGLTGYGIPSHYTV